MPGLVGAVCNEAHYGSKERLLGAIDLLGLSEVETADLDRGFIAGAALRNAPLKGPRCFQNDDFAAALSGDLVDVSRVPWERIVDAARTGNYDQLGELRGNFGLAVYDKKDQTVLLATDSRSQHPVYYKALDDGIIFSTEMLAFCRLPETPALSTAWLYEMIFFNFPVEGTSFLKDVYRLAPGSVLLYDLRTNSGSTVRYVPRFKRSTPLMTGSEALERALSVFGSRVPKYFENVDGQIAVSLTGGWDSRTILSLCPKGLLDSVLTYTYGIEGCDDLTEGAKVAKALGLNHAQILFDDKFLKDLPQLMPETVRLSNGVESVLRAPVLHALRILTQNGQACPVIISGVSFDALFKGYGNVPSAMSPGIDHVFREGRPVVKQEIFRDILGSRYDDFASLIVEDLKSIREKYGEFTSSDCHLSYLVYDIIPNNFLGEMALSNQFSTYRVPCWDDDITWLAYGLHFSRLRFSYYLGQPDPCEHNRLHTYLLRHNPDFAKVPMSGIPMGVWWRGKWAYDLHRLLFRGPRKLLGSEPRTKVPLTDWANWMRGVARESIDRLVFSKDSIIRDYIGPKFLAGEKQKRRPYWIGKLARLELILRQLRDGSW